MKIVPKITSTETYRVCCTLFSTFALWCIIVKIGFSGVNDPAEAENEG
jgi:hypothetical protein